MAGITGISKPPIHIIATDREILHQGYMVSALAAIWKDAGYSVTAGPVKTLDAGIGIVNIDRTRVPEGLLPENPKGRPMLNASILDISKRRVSRNLLTRDSSYKGKVIIKTDENALGLPERRSNRSFLRQQARSLLKRAFSWKVTRQIWYYKDYPICESLDSVPGWVWKRQDLVVEKFLPEIENGEYSLRMWVFFGDREYGVRMFGSNPLVKAGNRNRHEYIDEVPDSLRRIRKELKMDFGKFDYVIHDGEPVLFDVNKTPTVGGDRIAVSENFRRLASGIKMYEGETGKCR